MAVPERSTVAEAKADNVPERQWHQRILGNQKLVPKSADQSFGSSVEMLKTDPCSARLQEHCSWSGIGSEKRSRRGAELLHLGDIDKKVETT
jgi:hypothetical protein